MKGFLANIEEETLANENFRKVLYTGKNSQLVLMSLSAGTDIGSEIHPDIDQFIRVEKGSGKAVIDGVETEITDDWAVVIPAGSEHNIINTGDGPLKLYTIYSPPEHEDGIVRATKEEALAKEEHFDGRTTE